MTAISQKNDSNYLNLRSLDFSLQQKRSKPIYFKVRGENESRHVEAVHGRFATLIAKIACFLGVKSYNLKEVSTVLQKQIKELKGDNNPEHEKTCRSVAKKFISCIGAGGVEKKYGNRALPQIDRETISWQIKELIRKIPIGADSSDDETVDLEELFNDTSVVHAAPDIGISPLLYLIEKHRKVFEAIFDVKAADILEQKTDKIIKNIIDSQIKRCREKKKSLEDVGSTWYWRKGKYSSQDTLAGACFQRIWNRLEQPSEPNEELLSVLTEAKCFLLNAGIETTQKDEKKAQSARVVALIELREFLEKAAPYIDADKLYQLKNGLGEYADDSMQLFSASYLESITTEKIEELHSRLFEQLPELPQNFDNLKKELDEVIGPLAKDVHKDVDTTDDIPEINTPIAKDEILSEKQKRTLVHTTVSHIQEIFAEVLGINIDIELDQFKTVDEKIAYLANVFINSDKTHYNKFLSKLELLVPPKDGLPLERRQYARLTYKIKKLEKTLEIQLDKGQIYQKERLEYLQLFAAMLHEANAFVHRDQKVLALLDLLTFADMEQNAEILEQLAGRSGFIDTTTQTLKPSRLSSITTAEILQLKEKLLKSSENVELKNELSSHIDALVIFESLQKLQELVTQAEVRLEVNKKALQKQYPELHKTVVDLRKLLAQKHVTREEIQTMFKRLKEVATPLTTRGLWPHFGTLKRELDLLIGS